ncbi:hypothetical protein C7M84_014318 [Penaeus vannamei]|uniref:RFX1-4/6/8-like BCD domain-containing protein n=1 Tax=Penaeus vannamei TaxID=6689 RepID=A0A3R7NV62_PENVA|nr:hypothetical protein C7M84_014318 [Penaeus vannamei]
MKFHSSPQILTLIQTPLPYYLSFPFFTSFLSPLSLHPHLILSVYTPYLSPVIPPFSSAQIQSFLVHFWQGIPPHLVSILGTNVLVNLVGVCDSILYRAVCSVLMPSVLQSLSLILLSTPPQFVSPALIFTLFPSSSSSFFLPSSLGPLLSFSLASRSDLLCSVDCLSGRRSLLLLISGSTSISRSLLLLRARPRGRVPGAADLETRARQLRPSTSHREHAAQPSAFALRPSVFGPLLYPRLFGHLRTITVNYVTAQDTQPRHLQLSKRGLSHDVVSSSILSPSSLIHSIRLTPLTPFSFLIHLIPLFPYPLYSFSLSSSTLSLSSLIQITPFPFPHPPYPSFPLSTLILSSLIHLSPFFPLSTFSLPSPTFLHSPSSHPPHRPILISAQSSTLYQVPTRLTATPQHHSI